MIIEYKKQTKLSTLFEEKGEFIKYKEPGFLEKIGFKAIQYPDLYIHTGTLNDYATKMIRNSKRVVVNSGILKDKIVDKLKVNEEKIDIIFPINDVVKFKKKELKKEFYEKYNIPKKNKIIYFSALNFMRNGFENFCDIITKIEEKNISIFATCTIDKELDYAKGVASNFKLEDKIIFLEEEIYNVADIFVLPTINKNFSLNIVKAMSNKCVVFVTEENNSVELLDVFSIMDDPSDSNTAYKIDMLLRVPDEFKKIRKETFEIGKRLNSIYLEKQVDIILDKLSN